LHVRELPRLSVVTSRPKKSRLVVDLYPESDPDPVQIILPKKSSLHTIPAFAENVKLNPKINPINK